MVGMYGLWRYHRISYNMKTLRIVNGRGCIYVERRYFRRLWFRVSPSFRSNIEAYNWVRSQGLVNLVKRK